MKHVGLIILITIFGISFLFFSSGPVDSLHREGSIAAGQPYPPSPVIKKVIWDKKSLIRKAIGSDLWPTTWAHDDHIYTSWGDGGGFGGNDKKGRVSLGVARIEGHPETFRGFNQLGGYCAKKQITFEGKPTGLLCVDSKLYMGIVEQKSWIRWKIGKSEDCGLTWVFNGSSFDDYWDFAESDGAFSDTTFLSFGRNYQDAKNEYVFGYSQDNRANLAHQGISKTITMFRVHKNNLMDIAAYEFFAGINTAGQPLWTRDISERKPVFRDPNGVGWGTRVIYCKGIERYLLTTWHAWDGSWGIFDAPQPWGPWTTVAYYEQWLDDIPKFGFDFPQKWITRDGIKLWMVFSGVEVYDSLNVIQGTIILH
jgi:hypothetical protein